MTQDARTQHRLLHDIDARQRTARQVTAAASGLRLSASLQPSRRAPLSLSLGAFGIMEALACVALLGSGCAPVPTTFESYSVPLTRIDKIADPKIPPPGFNPKMEAYLRSSNEIGAPDFADRFTLVFISCGTGCTEYAVLDRVSGEVHPGDMVKMDYPPDYEGPYDFEFRRDSRLFVVHHAVRFEWPVYTSYYLWDGAQMKLLKTESKWPNKAPEPTRPPAASPASAGTDSAERVAHP